MLASGDGPNLAGSYLFNLGDRQALILILKAFSKSENTRTRVRTSTREGKFHFMTNKERLRLPNEETTEVPVFIPIRCLNKTDFHCET